MAKPSLPSSFSEAVAQSPQIKQRINAKLKYVHTHEKRSADPLRPKADPTKFPLINPIKNRNVTFSRSGRVMKDQSEKPQNGLSVFTILKYDHAKQESSLTCLGLDSGSSTTLQERVRSSAPLSLKTKHDGPASGEGNPVAARDSKNDDGEPEAERANREASGRHRSPTPPPEAETAGEDDDDGGESRVISSAVRRFRNFIMKETTRRDQRDYNDDVQSHASHEMSMTLSTRSELASQLSSRKTYPGKGRTSGRDFDADDKFGYTPSECASSSWNANFVSSRERGYYTPYRFSTQSEKGGAVSYPKWRKLPNRNHGAGKSSCKVDIGKLNKMKNHLTQKSVRRQTTELELPSVIDSRGNRVDQTGDVLGLENELGRSTTQQQHQQQQQQQQHDWYSHRARIARYRATREDGSRAADHHHHRANKAYQWKADITQPVAFISPPTNPHLAKDYSSLPAKYRLLKADPEGRLDDGRTLQHKAAVLRRLKGIFRKKGPHGRGTGVCEYARPGDMSNVQLAPTDHSSDASRMKGGKVQRGTFLTRHSKWVNSFQSLQEEGGQAADLDADFLIARSTCRPSEQTADGNGEKRGPSTPIDSELVISGTGRQSSAGLYELRMGDKSVLIIDHPRNRAARQARIRPQIEGAFLSQQEVTFSSDDLTTNSSMWVPPNTPHYDVTARTISHDDETFTAPTEENEKMNEVLDDDDDDDDYSEH